MANASWFTEKMAAEERRAAEKKAVPEFREGDFIFRTDGNSVVITGYEGTNTLVKIPSQIQGKPVIEIGEEAFLYNFIESVSFPDSLIKIGVRAFEGGSKGNKLTVIKLPPNLSHLSRAGRRGAGTLQMENSYP
jgi:hypothetical protein